MRTGVIKASAALFALALLVGVFGLNTQPTQAILVVDISSDWASVPAARAGYTVGALSGATGLVTQGGENTEAAIRLGAVVNADGETTLNLLRFLVGGDLKGDWLEVLSGPGAGKAGYIKAHDRVDAVPNTHATGDNSRNAYGAITFDGTPGLSLATTDLADGTVFQIVEENPTRTVALEIYHDDVTDGAPVVIGVQNSGVGESKDFSYVWAGTSVGASSGAPAIFKFDLAARNKFGTRTVAGVATTDGTTATVLDSDRDEPDGYWVGRTITVGDEERLITGFVSSTGSIAVTPAFGTVVVASTAYTINIVEVPAYEDQTATFQYSIYRRPTTTDKIGPIISSVSPVKGAVVQDGEIVFQADIIDVSSGFTSDEDNLEAETAIADGWIALEVLGNIIAGDDVTWTKISDGWRMTYESSYGTPDQTVPLPWRIIARDRAGAQSIQDHTSSSNLITVDGDDPEAVTTGSRAGVPGGITLQSRTGDNWRASNKENERWRSGGTGSHIVPIRKKSENRRGVLVVFNEAGGLDVGSVDASDFSVDGQTPSSVTVVDVIEDSKSAPDSKVRRPQEVFLLMAANLPSDGKDADDNRLEVVLSGTVRDVAGNSASSATIPLADGIPPRVTVVIDDADMFDQEEVTVQVSVDETLLAAPTLTVRQSISTSLNDADENVSTRFVSPVVNNTASQAYEVDIAVDDSGAVPEPNQAALISIVVNALDVASNEEEVGDDDDWTQAGAFTFELDPELNNSREPAITVAGQKIFGGKMIDAKGAVTSDDAEIEAVDPLLITIDFSRECAEDLLDGNTTDGCQDGGEEKEYAGDSHKTVQLSGVDVDVDLADGSGASPDFSVSSSDNITYTLSVRNPPVGDYTVSFRAADEAGNVSLNAGAAIADTLESEFVVKAAVATELRLDPGWNLISLPFQPANPSINSVLPENHPASLVMSYDNASGLWVVSRRDPGTGMFTGDVSQLVATTAYFVFTDSLEPIKLIRPGLATAAAAPAIPSAIAVKAGWNLVPVLTYQSPLPGDPPGSGGVSADDYLGALRNAQGDAAWLRALLWDTTSQTWTSVAPNDTVTLRLGDTNPCTDEALDAAAVESGEEPCQAQQTDHYNDADDSGSFNDGDTVIMERHLPLGAGLWVWSTIDSVIFPTA